MNAIEIRGLTKFYPHFKLGPLDMTVPKGAIYGFIGPNGAGKTTTIDLMLGLGRNDGGSISIFAKDHAREAVTVKQQIGYVSPDLNYAAWGRVRNAVQFIRGFYPSWDHAYCEELMEKFRLSPRDVIGTLSFGSKIKLALVLALAHRPALLVMDEPTAGLDAVSKSEVFAQLLGLVKEGEHTVLISSHGLGDIERFADHIGFIKDGRMRVEGGTEEVVGRYRMIDFSLDNAAPLESVPGLSVLARDSGRCRALVDTSAWVEEAGQRRGLVKLSSTPVTLEELFVSLAKN